MKERMSFGTPPGAPPGLSRHVDAVGDPCGHRRETLFDAPQATADRLIRTNGTLGLVLSSLDTASDCQSGPEQPKSPPKSLAEWLRHCADLADRTLSLANQIAIVVGGKAVE